MPFSSIEYRVEKFKALREVMLKAYESGQNEDALDHCDCPVKVSLPDFLEFQRVLAECLVIYIVANYERRYKDAILTRVLRPNDPHGQRFKKWLDRKKTFKSLSEKVYFELKQLFRNDRRDKEYYEMRVKNHRISYIDSLRDTLKAVNPGYCLTFDELLGNPIDGEQKRASYNNLIAARHALAHNSGDMTMSFDEVVDSYYGTKIIAETFLNIITS